MTYNIFDGGEKRSSMLTEIISQEKPDFLTINEAIGFEFANYRKLANLSQQVNLPYYHLALSGEFDYHVAVLSKYPLKSVQEINP